MDYNMQEMIHQLSLVTFFYGCMSTIGEKNILISSTKKYGKKLVLCIKSMVILVNNFHLQLPIYIANKNSFKYCICIGTNLTVQKESMCLAGYLCTCTLKVKLQLLQFVNAFKLRNISEESFARELSSMSPPTLKSTKFSLVFLIVHIF